VEGLERRKHGELAERLTYVFGDTVDPETWDDADEDEHARLVEKRFGAGSDAQRALRTAVVTQLVSGRPPQVWSTAQRLDGLGLPPERVINQLTIVLSQTLRDALGPPQEEAGDASEPPAGSDGPTDAADAVDLEAELLARLDRLPLPSPDAVERLLVDITAAAGVIDIDVLVAQVRGSFDGWEDDPVLAELVEGALDGVLADQEGPLVVLPGDDIGHADRLRDSIVLTSVLSESERAIGALTVSFDLGGFGRIPEPTFDGAPLEPVGVEPGHLAWMGDEGWLDRFDAGTTLAVRVDPDGVVRIDPLPEPPAIDPDLVAALLAAYHRMADEPELPVSGEDLVFALLAADREVFREPRAPLDALCEAAGLERRASAVAHDPAFWTNQTWLQRAGRIHAAAHGDEELAHDVLAVLDLVESDNDDDRDQVQATLDALDEIEVVSLVADELFDEDTWFERAEHAAALVERLLGLARRPGQRAAAHYLAAGAAERDRDLATAERHLQLAVDADPDHVLALDRLAWCASDRGDAARAARLWRRCPPAHTVGIDLATVEPFAAAPDGAGRGRNEPCWCGSGRKHKQCHLGVVARPVLADRVGWLYRKAAGYLSRSGPAARDAVVDLVAGLVGDEDEDRVMRVLEDPLTTDLVLTEGGWFRRFLADRGSLLPDDEAVLAAAWTTVDRSVYEVVDVTPRAGLALRDLRTGDVLDVRERTFSTVATTGMLVCARAVPDGETHQLVGAVRPVPPGREAELVDLLDRADPHEIAAWFAALEGSSAPDV